MILVGIVKGLYTSKFGGPFGLGSGMRLEELGLEFGGYTVKHESTGVTNKAQVPIKECPCMAVDQTAALVLSRGPTPNAWHRYTRKGACRKPEILLQPYVA